VTRTTHALLGAVAAAPLVFGLGLEPAPALSCVWWGGVGGGVPDWLDLRSHAGRLMRLKHRGASHGLPMAAATTVAVLLFLRAVGPFAVPAFDPADASLLAAAFGLGVLSHLAGDACTIRGIQPWLPLNKHRWWLLPRPLRGRSDGPLDLVTRIAAAAALVLGVVAYAARSGW